MTIQNQMLLGSSSFGTKTEASAKEIYTGLTLFLPQKACFLSAFDDIILNKAGRIGDLLLIIDHCCPVV
jgi:hypothetical protein